MEEYKNIMQLHYKSQDKPEHYELYKKYVEPEIDKIMKSESFSDVDECAGSISASSEMVGFVMGFKTAMELIKEC
ncbi:hypothetical protein ANASTE_00713 [Anaerofustis stercorihominis DSM 17244]|uniref:Uncharacterized protein n=1 Tax=Anaerofustis stercorihominis DSM 17244 TaxID=445971 RepID=B1C7L1_9FIRM|nr:hypothetical protein [Anaerofustis stercorihominis]EDS72998.1 hypothetical protein ANASTE_00713 [Anaerofustis stercorihominis DSM 17244]